MAERNYLHRLPKLLGTEQRIRFEAIAIAVDLVEIALESIRGMAANAVNRAANNPDKIIFDASERMKMIGAAWSILDQVHNVWSLIRLNKHEIDLNSLKTFQKSGKGSWSLRNKMDHLSGQIKNISKKYQLLPPIFGAISFACTVEDDIEKVTSPTNVNLRSYHCVTVFGSAIQTPFMASLQPKIISQIRLPVDHFCLQAFGEILDLDEACRTACALRDELAISLEQNCLAKATEIAAETGEAVEKLLEPVLESTTVVAKATFRSGFA